MKMMILIIGVIALVFGLTVILNYSPTAPDSGGGGGGVTETSHSGQLLRIPRVVAHFNPTSDDPYNRFLTNVYELGPEERPTSFWFQNVNPFPVRVSVLARSCAACTSARVAVLPHGAVEDLTSKGVPISNGARIPLGPFPTGPLPVPDLFGPLAAAALLKSVQWTEYDFSGQSPTSEIPAGAPEHPTHGVFQFGVKVSAVGPVARSVKVGFHGANGVYQDVDFTVNLVGVNPFIVTPLTLDAGEVAEDGPPLEKEVVYWSATRGRGELARPELAAPTGDALIAVGEPREMTEVEVRDFAWQVKDAVPQGAPEVARAGWSIPVTILPKLPANGPVRDIGPFERVVGVLSPGTDPARLTVRGTVTGLVGLKDGGGLKLGTINGATDVTRHFTLTSNRPDLEIEPVPEETRPMSIRVELGEPSMNGPRREWSMKLTIPAGSGLGELPSDSAVVLKTREAKPRLIRMPMSGNIFRR